MSKIAARLLITERIRSSLSSPHGGSVTSDKSSWLLISSTDAAIPWFMGRIVTFVSQIPPDRFLAETWPWLVGMLLVVVVARPLVALTRYLIINQAIAALRQHIKPNQRIHGVITDGGAAANVVPERAAGRFLVRAETAKDLAALRARVIACLESGAQASGARLEFASPELDTLDMIHSMPLCNAFQRNAEALGRVFVSRDHPAYLRAASTDMGNVSHYVPAIHPNLAAAPADCVIHNAEFARWAGS